MNRLRYIFEKLKTAKFVDKQTKFLEFKNPILMIIILGKCQIFDLIFAIELKEYSRIKF